MISVILLTRNRSQMLMRAIQSILTQTYQDFELLIFDHNSTDDTKEVIDCFKSNKIRYFLEPEDSNIPKMRNKGTREAKGEWIAIADDDDLMIPCKLEEQIKIDADMIYSGWSMTDIIKDIKTEYPAIPFTKERLYFGRVFTHTTLLIRKEWLEKFPYDESINWGSDYKMALTMAKNNARFGWVDKILVHRYSHGENITLVFSNERLAIVKRVKEEFVNSFEPEEWNKLRKSWSEIKILDSIKTMNKKISVIIPYYNKKESLREVLFSLSKQNYTNFEVIIADDGSEDKPIEFLNDFPSVKYFWQTDKGYCLNTVRNMGRRIASGDILLYLDADIIPIGEDFLLRIIKWHLQNSNKIVTFHRIRKDGNILIPDRKKEGNEPWRNLSGGMFSVEASVFDKIGEWDEHYNGEWGLDDVDFGYRAAQKKINTVLDKSFEVFHIEHPKMEKLHKKNAKYFQRKFNTKKSENMSNLNNEVPLQRPTTLNYSDIKKEKSYIWKTANEQKTPINRSSHIK